MSSQAFDDAWKGIEASWKKGQLAHAYLLQGASPALRFAEKLLNLLFDHHPQIQTKTHPDLIWIEPQSKSRRIGIHEIRAMIQQLSQTSFSGGWKTTVLIHAERMTPEASNALLKTLEEPPPKTLLILITHEPQSLLPTITSRCQRIVLAHENDDTALPVWKTPLLSILRNLPPRTTPEAALAAAQLADILKKLYATFESEELENIPDDLSAKESKTLLEARATSRMIQARSDILCALLLWQRDLLCNVLGLNDSTLHFPDEKKSLMRQALLCTRAKALQRMTAVEKMERQLDRNLPAELVFNEYISQLL